MKKKNLFFVFLFLIFSFYIWQGIYQPKYSLASSDKIFEIKKGENVFKISRNLEKEGLIKNKIFFDLYVVLNFSQNKLKAGFYSLSPSFAINSIAQKIIAGDIAKFSITVPEGFTQKQIEERLGFELPGQNQGYLFPDTYKFSIGITPEKAVEIMRNNFEAKIEPYKKEILDSGFTLQDLIIMASLLEKEVKTKEEKEMVAGLLWKRMRSGMFLQVDAAPETYNFLGLPSNPIANPGLESILAALYPRESPYWYYLSTLEGNTIFSKTLQEHNIAKAKYLTNK